LSIAFSLFSKDRLFTKLTFDTTIIVEIIDIDDQQYTKCEIILSQEEYYDLLINLCMTVGNIYL